MLGLVLLTGVATALQVGTGGFGLYFDHRHADVVGFANFPSDNCTVEYWLKVIDLQVIAQAVLSYSVYTPTYEQVSLILQHLP